MTKDEALQKVTDGDGDFQVFTADEHKEFLNNLKDTDIFRQQIDGRVSEMHRQYDDDFFEVTGKRRGQDEKTYDFIKREFSNIKKTAADLAEKNQSLQKAIDGKGDEAYEQLKKEHDTVLQKHQDAMKEWQGKFEAKEKEQVMTRIKGQLESSTSKLKFLATVPQEAVNGLVEITKSKLSASAKMIENTVVYLDGNGDVRLDDMMRPLTTDFVVAEELKSIIDTGRIQTGVDIKEPKVEKDADGKIVVHLSLPDSVKTNVDLTEFLLKSGLKRGTAEYMAAYEKYRDKVKLIT